jgi:hypothetical protein
MRDTYINKWIVTTQIDVVVVDGDHRKKCVKL